MTVDTKEIVTTIGYMIGVKKNILELSLIHISEPTRH